MDFQSFPHMDDQSKLWTPSKSVYLICIQNCEIDFLIVILGTTGRLPWSDTCLLYHSLG